MKLLSQIFCYRASTAPCLPLDMSSDPYYSGSSFHYVTLVETGDRS